MNSLKNTIVIVLLLGVSYGVYQVVNVPEVKPDEAEATEIAKLADLEITDELDTGGLTNSGLANDGPADEISPPPAFNALPPSGFQPSETSPPPSDFSPASPAANSLLPPMPNLTQQLPTNPPSSRGGAFESAPPPTSPTSVGFPEVRRDLSPPVENQNAFAEGNPLPPMNSPPSGAFNPSGQSTGDSNAFSDPNLVDVPPPNANPMFSQAALPSNGDVNALSGTVNSGPPASGFANALDRANEMIATRDFKTALQTLSPFYHADLAPADRESLVNYLDSLTGKVVYSTDHSLTGAPYEVVSGDTLSKIAGRWGVPPQLVYNVNRRQLESAGALQIGMQLKKITGPFKAEIDRARKEMTLFVDGMYAGRFPVNFDLGTQVTPGSYTVRAKSNQGYAGPGQHVLDLGNVQIQSTSDHAQAVDKSGSIHVADQDADDVFGILSQDSEVIIR